MSDAATEGTAKPSFAAQAEQHYGLSKYLFDEVWAELREEFPERTKAGRKRKGDERH